MRGADRRRPPTRRTAGDVPLSTVEDTDAGSGPQDQEGPGGDSPLRAGADAFVVGFGYLASFAYPLVSLPLLSRIFGAHDLGRFMFALALIQLVIQLTDFGFGRSALRRIAVATTTAERSRIVSATLGAKGVLWALASGVLMTIVLVVPSLRDQWVLYAVGLALVGVGAAYPTWLLQGMGRIRWFALLTSASRLVALLFLVLTVRDPSDAVLAMIWQQFPLALSALTSWVMIALVWRDVTVVRPRPGAVREALADSWPMFVANLANVTISGSNTVVLGVVANPSQVAYFGAGERFANAVRGIMQGVTDAMLPRMTRDRTSGDQMERVIMVGIAGAYALAGISLAVIAPFFIPWYLGGDLAPAVPVTQVIGLSLVLSGIQMAQFLRATAQHRFPLVARIATVATICHIALLFPAAWLWGAVGAAAVAIVSECTMVALYIADSVRRRGQHPSHDAPRAEEARPS